MSDTRLVAALRSVLPLLVTQQDEIFGRSQSVNAIYRVPITESERLRREATRLEDRDALILELRAALREHDATTDLKNKIEDGTIK